MSFNQYKSISLKIFLTSIVANNEVHIGPELEWTEQMVTHEILYGDAFDNSNISQTLKINNKK